jgi:hypothetical protein
MSSTTEQSETQPRMEGSSIHQRMARIQAALAKSGVAKGRVNQQQKFPYRGVDDIYAALAPLMAENEVIILPTVIDRTVSERVTERGTKMSFVAVDVKYAFVGAAGDRVEARMFGEAMDSGDKATAKALSMAFKSCMVQVFSIPTEGDNDPDAVTHEPSIETNRPIPETNRSKPDKGAATYETVYSLPTDDDRSPAVGSISEKQRLLLKSTIEHNAKVEGIPHLMERVLGGLKAHLNVMNIKDIPSDKFELVMTKILPKSVEREVEAKLGEGHAKS